MYRPYTFQLDSDEYDAMARAAESHGVEISSILRGALHLCTKELTDFSEVVPAAKTVRRRSGRPVKLLEAER